MTRNAYGRFTPVDGATREFTATSRRADSRQVEVEDRSMPRNEQRAPRTVKRRRRLMSELMEQKDDVHTDECLALLGSFMKVKDRKARAEIIKLAERCAYFDAGGIVVFGQESQGK